MALCHEFNDRHSDLNEWPDKLKAFSAFLFHALSHQEETPDHAVELARYEYIKASLACFLGKEIEPTKADELKLAKHPGGFVKDNGKELEFEIGFTKSFRYDVLMLANQRREDRARSLKEKNVSIVFYQISKYWPPRTTYLENIYAASQIKN